MTRVLRLGLAAVVLATALVVATPAGGARECDGLQVCVPVAGPWVAVPAPSGAARARVEWQLRCPRRYVVGGLDARLSVPAIDVFFLGRLGSPVNPGITTDRTATFLGAHVGFSRNAGSFRPFIGCIPSAGGGSRIPTAVTQAFPPGEPTTRRVRTVRVRPGATTVTVGCTRRERIVGSSHAFGFGTRSAPSPSLLASVSGRRATAGRRVVVRVRGDAELQGVRTFVQVHALCARVR